MSEHGLQRRGNGSRSAAAQRPRRASAYARSLDEARSTLASRLRERRSELEAGITTRVYAISDPRDVADPAYLHCLHAALAAAVDGSHPPAVRTVTLDIDRTIQINAVGLPACRPGQLQAQTTAAAKKACPGAIVGSGKGEVEVAFPEQEPFSATGPIVLFNGGVHGGSTLLFIHTYVAVPAPTAVIAAVKITHIHRGHFDLHTVTQIPVIAGGAGSITKFELNIGRKFAYKGTRESYLTASCPTGHYVTEGEVLFGDGTKLGLTHVLPCTPEG